ncbi:MAG: SDR family NAD(P)-dependent oxidoreductase [Candidatus Dadabacteria bacterium]|nr:SDR family NAD(P)-dependent oxidoreductase [Candidatus Dadabacteria bacterium]MDE0663167.1 SDR family NAD(P)-dependent oxidoreductase [Candidatus Dadabacteria bacterium]
MAEKIVIVTGATRGIGKATAVELLEAGFFTALCSRNRQTAASLETEISSFAGNFMISSIDISVEEEVREFISGVVEKKGRIDVLINNAGVVHTGPMEKTDTEKWDEMMAVNAKGPFLMAKHALAFMPRGGHIVNIGSNASKKGFPGWAAYCASKFAVLGFTNSLREEVRDRGIKVSAVLPGPTRTDIWDSLGGQWDRKKMMSPEVTAKTVLSVITQPPGANIDEIDIVPSTGSL